MLVVLLIIGTTEQVQAHDWSDYVADTVAIVTGIGLSLFAYYQFITWYEGVVRADQFGNGAGTGSESKGSGNSGSGSAGATALSATATPSCWYTPKPFDIAQEGTL